MKGSELEMAEIELFELFRIIWFKRWFIVKVSFIFFIIGLVIGFTTPKSYKATCTLIPEALSTEGKLSGSLGGLASLAGIDLGDMSSGGTTINPALYQSVAKSTPFLLYLMEKEFYFSDLKREITLYEYYQNHYKLGLLPSILTLPRKVLNLRNSEAKEEDVRNDIDEEIIRLNNSEEIVARAIANSITVYLDWDLNVVFIESEMQDPVVAAQITRYTQEYITSYVTEYAVSKSLEQLEFVTNQFAIKRSEFVNAQLNLANFQDDNQNVKSAKKLSEEQRLQSEYNLAFNVYNELAQQVEQLKLLVNRNKPVFTELEPVRIPVEKNSPKRGLILFVSTILGLIISFLWIIVIVFINSNKVIHDKE